MPQYCIKIGSEFSYELDRKTGTRTYDEVVVPCRNGRHNDADFPSGDIEILWERMVEVKVQAIARVMTQSSPPKLVNNLRIGREIGGVPEERCQLRP